MSTPRYSILVPVYCEAESLSELTARIATVFDGMGKAGEFEIVLVDDGSTDSTPDVARQLAQLHSHIRVVTLRRNCGKSLALSAGFRHVRGRFIVTLDADLQDQPEDIPRLLEQIEGGYDMVNGWRTKRRDTFVRRLGSSLFNWFVGYRTGLRLHDFNCGLKGYRRQVAEVLCVYGQYHRYIPLQAHLAGFKVAETAVNNAPRKYGYSKFRTFRYEGLFDLLSLLFLEKYGLNPMHFFGKLSLAIMLPSLAVIFYLVAEQIGYWLGYGAPVFNRPLLAIALAAFLLGVIIFTTGFVCDFILHHMIRARLDSIIATTVAHVTGEEPANSD